MNERQSLELSILISRALEGALTEAEYQQLNRLLEDPEVRTHYFEQLKVNLALRDVSTHEIKDRSDNEVVLDDYFWQQLARTEQYAPAVEPEDPSADSRRIPVVKVEYEKTVHRVNKTSLAVAISAMAALVFLLIYINTHPVIQMEAATVVDAYDAQWAGTSLLVGDRVNLSRQNLVLSSGIVKLESNEGVDILIEGPAEFRFSGDTAIELEYGRLFARVGASGIGFSVSTPVSRVIDLGTAFGVRAGLGGNTELHVFEGKTSLSLKDRVASGGSNQIVTEGQAKAIDGKTLSIAEINLGQEDFIEDINSKHHWVYRGQQSIQLADIVGGGNGLGTGKRGMSINPITSAFTEFIELNRWTENRYNPVPQNPFVDGVFIPNGSSPQQVSSRGHLFKECPETCGIFYTDVTDTPKIVDSAPLCFNGIEYGQSKSSCIFLHANLGVTFDLDTIRNTVALFGKQLSRFETLAGISNAAWRDCNADIWVLVDGQVRYCRRNIQVKGYCEMVDIALSSNDHYLTLVATDGGDQVEPGERQEECIDSDWCLFNEPVLVLE